MEAQASGASFVYDALPALTLAAGDLADDSSSTTTSASAAAAVAVTVAVAGDDDPTATYAVFRNEITEAGDAALAEIPAADFFSLDVVSQTPSPPKRARKSSLSAPPDQPAQGSESAWFRDGRRFKSPMLQLHKEILDFCDFISATAEEQASRSAAVQSVSEVVKHIWPQCKVEVFGSFRTGLYLPTSDIDVVILQSRVKTPQVGLYALAKALSQRGIAKKIQVIAKARVPIVKFVERNSGIAFDISFDLDSGLKAADFIKDAVQKLPALRPLCMILKVFLHQRELNEVYSGGIGSYALLTMLITHLQLIWEGQDMLGHRQPKEHNLGILLVKFFDFYGRKLNNFDVGISCNSTRTFFLKSNKKFVNFDRPSLLSIQDPLASDNDIAKNSFNYFRVKSAFSNACSTLTDANSILSLGPKRSILGTIIRPDPVLLNRKGGNNGEVTFSDMLPGSGEPLALKFDGDNDIMYNWHLSDDEPLPRGSLSPEAGTSASPSRKRKPSRSRQRSRKKERQDTSASEHAENGFRKEGPQNRRTGPVQNDSSQHSSGSRRRRKGPREYDRFTNTLPRYASISRW